MDEFMLSSNEHLNVPHIMIMITTAHVARYSKETYIEPGLQREFKLFQFLDPIRN